MVKASSNFDLQTHNAYKIGNVVYFSFRVMFNTNYSYGASIIKFTLNNVAIRPHGSWFFSGLKYINAVPVECHFAVGSDNDYWLISTSSIGVGDGLHLTGCFVIE